MPFEIPVEAFRNDTIYHQFGSDYRSNILGCGFLNKKNNSCKEANIVFSHYGAVLVLSGKGVHVDEEGNETEVFPGCLIQRIPEKHQSLFIHPDGSWLEFFICISKNMYDALISMDLLDSRQNVLYPGLSRAIFDRFNEFLDLMKHTHPTEINMLIPEALKIILMLHSLHKENISNSKDREIVHKACLILTKPSSYDCSIQDLARELGIGYEKFRKLFKKQVGVSPGCFVMQKRMDVAKTYLIEKSKSVKEIAVELGFSDAYAFSKQFRQSVGISPSEFRRVY
ncbi:MAG TPA: AraC family transcriptional regulator [Mobilitalea sp.]|nr:AraC family transcriptional regulator [Mobilitalea sp.]